MRRIYPALIVVLVIICSLAVYIFLAKPVVALPPITVTLPENNTVGAYQRRYQINQLDFTLRTNGRLSVAADGQRLAFLSYNLDSLTNATRLAGRLFFPQPASLIVLPVLLVLVVLLSPQLVWSAFLACLSLYFVFPLEITVRFIPG